MFLRGYSLRFALTQLVWIQSGIVSNLNRKLFCNRGIVFQIGLSTFCAISQLKHARRGTSFNLVLFYVSTDRDRRQDNRPHAQQRQHFMDVANIRVREAFQRLRQFAVAVGNDHGIMDAGNLLLREENLPIVPQAAAPRPQQPNPRHEVDIQLRVVREDADNPVPVPTRTPKVPKTVLISGAVPMGTFCEVIVSKVISPSMFWVRMISVLSCHLMKSSAVIMAS